MAGRRWTVQTKATGGDGRRWSGSRARADSCLVSLAGTIITGLLLHGEIPHGDAWEAVASSGERSVGLQILHVLFAAGLTVSIGWHLVDKRRTVVALARRKSGRTVRCLLAYVGLVGLLAASLVTGVVGEGRSQVAHHLAVSIVLAVACAWHGVRRMARRRRGSYKAPVEARP
jgi:hypothetical protein